MTGELIFKTEDIYIKLLIYVFPGIGAISTKLYIKGNIISSQKTCKLSDTSIESNNTDALIDAVLPENGVIDSFNISDKHIKARAVRLYDQTDVYNELVSYEDRLLYRRYDEYLSGSFLILDNYTEKKAIMLVSEGYVSGKKFCLDNDFSATKDAICVFGSGIEDNFDDYVFLGGVTAVIEAKEKLTDEYKAFYSCLYKKDDTFIMSNTWGDRKRDTSVSEEFIKKEIDVGTGLGIDILQIDDGWQKGLSANSGFTQNGAWGDFYDSDPDFWEINPDRFPNGFSVIKEYADKKGMKLGLWFSMDKENSYARWKRDAEKILELYEKYGVSYFKIDGLVINNHECEKNIYNFCELIDKRANGKINFNFDITANRRFGYFIAKQHSTLFVENRYTDWRNYYPHRTLRNLWSLCEYIPAHKMQFEVLNQLRNDDIYKDDLLKPSLYPIDYMFASVMIANPLIWMEMSGLNDNQVEMLRKIISVYKNERKYFKDAVINPIGDRPDGISYTGFIIERKEEGYLILLKELCDDDTYKYLLNIKISDIEVLASNSNNAELSYDDKGITVKNMDKAGYIFLKYKK